MRSELRSNKVINLSQAFEEKGELDNDLENLINGKALDIQVSEGFKVLYWQDERELRGKIEKEFVQLCANLKITGTRQEQLHQILGLESDGKISKKSNPTLDNFQLLTPYLSGLSGADGLNDYFQKEFKKDLELGLVKGLFKESDKIIRTRNYYKDDQLIISNGSIGIIKGKGKEVLYFQENDYSPLKLNELRKNEKEFFELSYAISIHKSQGSGFDHLFIIVPDRPGLLSREIMYTALTSVLTI